MEDLRQKELHIAFAGTPELAAGILESLLKKSKHQITMVLTRIDRPAGRGRKLAASPVKILALENDLPVFQPSQSELPALEKKISEADLMVVAAYGMLLPESILNAPKYGCINVHTSLLPRWRGAAPIHRAIQAGDGETGISIMQMDNGLDSGPVLLQTKCPVSDTDTSASLLIRLTHMGSECLLRVLQLITSAELQPTVQNDSLANYAKKVTKSEARIDWSQTAVTIDRTIRAFNPAPICYTELAGMRLRIWQAEILNHDSTSTAGEIIACSSTGIDVATGQGILRILMLQPQGKRVMSVADFLNGNPAFGVNN